MTAADRVIENAARAWSVPVAELLGPGKRQRLCWARWSAMGALSDMGWSTPAIGRALNRDHTTVLYGLGRLKR
jgi:chromosomal replication initiation ATPase DnaA